MITAFALKTVVYLVGTMLAWLPDALTLPLIGGFDIDSALSDVFAVIHGINALIPPFAVIFNALVWYYSVMLLIVSVGFIRWIIGLIRGSGS